MPLHDISDKFEIPQKLYGREKEVESLLNSFERIKENTKEIFKVEDKYIPLRCFPNDFRERVEKEFWSKFFEYFFQ